jgi:hypothetical protein
MDKTLGGVHKKDLVDVACRKIMCNKITGNFKLVISPVDVGFLRHGNKYYRNNLYKSHFRV